MLCFSGQGHLYQDLYSAFEEIGPNQMTSLRRFCPLLVLSNSLNIITDLSEAECLRDAEEMIKQQQKTSCFNYSNLATVIETSQHFCVLLLKYSFKILYFKTGRQCAGDSTQPGK